MQLAGSEVSATNQASRSGRVAGNRGVDRAASQRSVTRHSAVFRSLVSCAALALAAISITGCGDNYRPVISAVNPVGPAAQPAKYAVAISDPNQGSGGTLPGLATVVDFSGDTVLITPSLGVKPEFLFMGAHGNTAYILNGDGTVNSFPISTTLISSNVNQTTLLSGANANTIFPQGSFTYITQPGRTSVAELTGSPPTLQQEIPVGPNPVYIAGIPSAPRIYSISQGTPQGVTCPSGNQGAASAIETSNNTVSNVICTGTAPVYGIMTADAKRAFVVNNGSNNITAINAQQNTLDNNPAAPNGSNSTQVAGSGLLQDPAAVKPIWADFAPPLSELIVANQGDGTSNGSVSIFSIPLCSAAALGTNPACDSNNPIDAVTFGTLVAHITVGKNPVMVAALQDGSQAYVINEGDSTVSVINLTTNTVTATVSLPATPNPSFVAVTTGTPTGKVYVTSGNSTTMTILRTDTNAIQTTIPLQGTGVQVRTTLP